MFNYLEQLRKKSLYYRKRLAVITAAIVTGLIVLIWLSTLNFGTGESVVDEKAVAEELKPLKQIKESVVDFYSSVKEMGSELFGVASSNVSN